MNIKSMAHNTRKDRIYNNTEIQELIVEKAMLMSNTELDRYCKQDYCKIKFDINYALFICADATLSQEKLDELILDDKGYNRWTWKYKFQVGSKVYAITTQWYDRNDEYVKKWLSQN